MRDGGGEAGDGEESRVESVQEVGRRERLDRPLRVELGDGGGGGRRSEVEDRSGRSARRARRDIGWQVVGCNDGHLTRLQPFEELAGEHRQGGEGQGDREKGERGGSACGAD